MDDYQKTINWLFKQLPMYQRQGSSAYKTDLTNTVKLCNYLDNPERKFKAIHIAGTNGKGSTAHMLSSVFQEAGYRTGLYTSPHLKDFRERIKINGQMIPEQDVVDFVHNNKAFFKKNKLSFFEMTVGLAFDFFSKKEVDIAIIETGLGGRLDSTNVIKPLLSVITNIGLDHTKFLGESYEEIASEKAGIIKKNIPVVVGQTQEKSITDIFKRISRSKDAKLYFADQLEWLPVFKTDLKGKYQKDNTKTAIAAIKVLQLQGEPVTDDNIMNGLQNVVYNTGLQGRWQRLLDKPLVICDTAHNKEGLELVMEQISEQEYDKLHIVVGMVNDKNVEAALSFFPKEAKYYFCQADIPRALDVKILSGIAKTMGLNGDIYSSVRDAYAKALECSAEEDFIYIGGSTFVVAEVV
ncbi:MAG: folylpolyglutamate synthase/dihydrofolate synthase family protein [Bacteroidota bacterium]